MDKREIIFNTIAEQGLLPLFYHDDENICLQLVTVLYAAGIRLIEFTNRGQNALHNFKKIRQLTDSSMPGLFIGAGTIKNAKAASEFIAEGADFIVSPGLMDDVYDVTYSGKTLWIPGCMTPTEIIKAEQFGLTLVKLFPGNLLGPSFVKAIKEIFPSMHFMPTGGVETTRENLQSWFASGVSAVGMGSKLFNRELLENGDFAGIGSAASGILGLVADLRKNIK